MSGSVVHHVTSSCLSEDRIRAHVAVAVRVYVSIANLEKTEVPIFFTGHMGTLLHDVRFCRALSYATLRQLFSHKSHFVLLFIPLR